MRILRTRGDAWIGGEHVTKDFAPRSDEWTHPYHGPDNNPQSADEVAKRPYLTHFMAEPWYCPLPQMTVISGGRLFKVFGRGTIEFLPLENRKVLAYVRRSGDDTILCAANLSRTVQPAALELQAFAGMVPVEMVGYTEFPAIGAEPYFLTLGPYDFYWFELQRAGG